MRYKEFQTNEMMDALLKSLIGGSGSGLSDIGMFSKKSTDTKTEPSKTDTQPTTGSKETPPDIKDKDFDKKMHKIAGALGITYENLYKIIKFESAGSFSPKSQDPWGVSVGLIGFTEQTARSLGTTKAALAKMTAVEQLDYVYLFYKKAGVQPGEDVGTMYMRTFMPAFVHAPDGTVLGKKGGGALMLPSGKSSGLSMHKVWEQNPGFGKSKGKSYFTVGDVKSLIRNR